MEQKNVINNTRLIIVFLVIIIMFSGGIIILKSKLLNNNGNNSQIIDKPNIVNDITGNYNIDIIKAFNSYAKDNNYLISPYNIEVALNMLREGALGKTKEELDNVLGNRNINDISVENTIGISNGLFIKDIYKNNVKSEYYNILNNKYHADIIYDKFISPDKINNWVKEKTNGMIEKILNDMSPDFVMGLASALAIDVKWQNEFECNRTTREEFTINNKTIYTEMMHNKYEFNDYKYLKNEDSEGIIIPYRKIDDSNIQLEFIGIISNKGINDFVNNLTKEKLDSIINNGREAGDNLHINVSLPRFKYDYEAKDKTFIDVLKSMGLNEMFNPNTANFKKMIEIDENVYVSEAIHKTHIELNEKGTKAAAVTYFGLEKNALIEPKDIEEVNIEFNRPFVYFIREKNSGEILFFGTVYEPNKWEGNTCENN